MKIIRNRWIPFKGFKAVNLFGVLFIRKGCWMSRADINHEKIHTAQMRELLYIPFYILYLLEWLVRLPFNGNAYRNISFEKEAYKNQYNLLYLHRRKLFAQWRGENKTKKLCRPTR